MINLKYEISPSYRLRTYLRTFFLLLGTSFILISFLSNALSFLLFVGLVLLVVGVLATLFGSKQRLIIDENHIVFETKSFIKEFSNKTIIPIKEIDAVTFQNRQFLILGGRNPIADSDSQTLYTPNRIVFQLKDYHYQVIQQIGKPKDFRMAFEVIQTMIKK